MSEFVEKVTFEWLKFNCILIVTLFKMIFEVEYKLKSYRQFHVRHFVGSLDICVQLPTLSVDVAKSL